MKKSLQLTFFTLFIVLTGCGYEFPNETSFEVVTEVDSNKVYRVGESIEIKSGLKNIGTKSVTIVHIGRITYPVIYDSEGLKQDESWANVKLLLPQSHKIKNQEVYYDQINYSFTFSSPGEYHIVTSSDFEIRYKRDAKNYQLHSEKIKVIVTE